MRLSEAIALGRTLCIPVPETQDDLNGGGCALGMAARAMGVVSFGGSCLNELNYDGIKIEAHRPCSCPTFGNYWDSKLVGVIAHLFNEHVFGAKDWTLDQLIDWVRSIEPAEPAPAAAEQQVAETMEIAK